MVGWGGGGVVGVADNPGDTCDWAQRFSKGNNELFNCQGSNLMKSQKSTAHAVQDSYPIYKYRTDVVDAVFLYGSAASKERNLSAWAASLT